MLEQVIAKFHSSTERDSQLAMPPVFQAPEEPALTFSFRQVRDNVILQQKSISSQSVRILDRVRPKSSELGCKGYSVSGIDTGPCRSRVVSDSSIIAILCVIATLCVAGFVKLKHSWITTAAERRTRNMERQDRSYHSGRRRRERREHNVRRHLQGRQRDLSARTITDLSGQQLQLREHLAQLLARHESVLAQQRAQGLQASTDMSRLRTPGAAHLRDRERDWEEYQLRSNQEILAGLENTRSIIPQVFSSEGVHYPSNVLRVQPSLETLPEYALEDPLRTQQQAPLNTTESNPHS